MVVSSIKPIEKNVKAYYNYIFGPAHNGNEKRNMNVYGLAGVAGFEDPDDMYKMMDIERKLNPNARRRHEAYTVMMSFSKDEIDPNNPEDVEKAQHIINDSISSAYPNRSAVVALQSDGKGGCLHGHVLLNNVDSEGKAISNGWKHMKSYVDEATVKHGLEPLSVAKGENDYDWREDLESRINFATSKDDLEHAGVKVSGRWRKRDKTTQLTFKFTDEEGKSRTMRGRRLASILGYEDENAFCLEHLEQRWEQKEDIADQVEEVEKEYDPFAEDDIRNMPEDILDMASQENAPEMGL